MTALAENTEDGSVWAFAPTPKLQALPERAVAIEETERRLDGVLARVPVTRVNDISPLDPMKLPVFSAVTPLARDLTTHMGKGLDPQAARVSALMEAVERVSAEQFTGAGTIWASFRGLVDRAVVPALDPSTMELPWNTRYTPDTPIQWCEGQDLGRGTPVLLPTDLAVSPPSEGVLTEADTNGLASGNNRLEAVIHGLCEVIERDAVGQLEFTAAFCDADAHPDRGATVDPDTVPVQVADWIACLEDSGLIVVLRDVTSDVAIATLQAEIRDPAFPSPDGPVSVSFKGWGCHPDAQVAALRAITEAVQGRVGFIQGARDSFNTTPGATRLATRLVQHARQHPDRSKAFADIPSYPSVDLLDDLTRIMAALQAAGFERAVAVDLTRADLGIPVVRVRVPGLTAYCVNRRRVGWRCLRHLL